MPKELVDTFIRVLSQVPQRVFWKWEGDFPGSVTPNIMIVDGMLPQQDLLGNFYPDDTSSFILTDVLLLSLTQDIRMRDFLLIMLECWGHRKQFIMVCPYSLCRSGTTKKQMLQKLKETAGD